jgi:hypothetical protein
MRDLPDDASIEALDAASRLAAAEAWLGRSASEGGAAENFRMIARSLREANAAPALIDIATSAVDDEIEHAEICRRVASRYLGKEAPSVPPRTASYPEFAGAPAPLAALLHVMLNCCFNETTATAYLQLCMRDAKGPLVRAALREFLSDDVGHARLGWSVLSSTLGANPTLAPVISRYLKALTQMNLRTWHVGQRPMYEGPAHGCPLGADVAVTVLDAMRTLVFPGLAGVGLDVTEASAFLDAFEA